MLFRSEIETGAADIDRLIDVVGSSVGSGSICGNIINCDALAEAGIRIQTFNNFRVSENEIYCVTSGAVDLPIGILIGATARGGTENGCTKFLCQDNNVTSNGPCIVITHPGSGTNFGGSVVSGNSGFTVDTSVGEFEMWNLGAHPTTFVFHLTISDNHADVDSTSVAGWVNYTGVGTTRGGRAGDAAASYLNVVGNTFPGTVFDDAAAGADFQATAALVSGEFYGNSSNIH